MKYKGALQKRILGSVLLVILLQMCVLPTYAASYPTMYPDDYNMVVFKGNKAELKFTVFHEYKNEKYHVNIYKGDKVSSSNLVSTIENTMYATELSEDITLYWDTSKHDSGTYTVEYYMSFYTLYSWHDAPTKTSVMKIKIVNPGEAINKVLNTDIKATIDGHPIRSYNIDGKTAIVAEDLREYGFNVTFDSYKRTLKIAEGNKRITSKYTYTPNTMPIGSVAMDVIVTDIRTLVDHPSYYGGGTFEAEIDGFNVNGYTVIFIDDLDVYGNVIWNESSRTISFIR